MSSTWHISVLAQKSGFYNQETRTYRKHLPSNAFKIGPTACAKRLNNHCLDYVELTYHVFTKVVRTHASISCRKTWKTEKRTKTTTMWSVAFYETKHVRIHIEKQVETNNGNWCLIVCLICTNRDIWFVQSKKILLSQRKTKKLSGNKKREVIWKKTPRRTFFKTKQ